MAKKLLIPIVVALLLGAFTLVGAIPPDDTQVEKVEKSLCLACHGSFDDIAAATAEFKAPSGEIGTPHRYVPHAEKTDIPECVECHVPHKIPPEPDEKIIKPEKIDWCYSSCHHAQNLQPCSKCH